MAACDRLEALERQTNEEQRMPNSKTPREMIGAVSYPHDAVATVQIMCWLDL